jgi:hypothetical protein
MTKARVRTLCGVLAIAAAALVTATAVPATAAPPAKVTICHVDWDDPVGPTSVVISISESAWPAHDAHEGDYRDDPSLVVGATGCYEQAPA